MRRDLWRIIIIGAAGGALLILVLSLASRLQAQRHPRAVPILMYHRIAAVPDSAWCVSPDLFERQMRFLCEQGYNSILPADLAAYQHWGSPLPKRPVIITFDDGYLDSLTVAEPILRKYGLRGSVYLITDRIAANPAERCILEGVSYLTWPEVRAARRRGTLSFGGHGHSHQNMAVIADPFGLAAECYRQFIHCGGFIPDSFSYPFGQHNQRAQEAVAAAGFGTALACGDAMLSSAPDLNLLALPRISVMGGHHDFSLQPVSTESASAVVWHVKHVGVPIAVTPHLRGLATSAWLPPQELDDGTEAEWRWQIDPLSDSPGQLEIWDRHRLLPLYP